MISHVEVGVGINNVVAVHLIDLDLYIAVVYRPPSYNFEENSSLSEFFSSFSVDKECIFMGDLNLPSIQWNLDDPLSVNMSTLDRIFFYLFGDCALTQLVNEATNFPSCTIIDLILCSNAGRIGNSCVLSPFPRCSHAPTLTSYIFQEWEDDDASDEFSFRLWSRGDYQSFSNHLCLVDWMELLDGLDPGAQYDKFLKFLEPLLERFVPKKRKSKH